MYTPYSIVRAKLKHDSELVGSSNFHQILGFFSTFHSSSSTCRGALPGAGAWSSPLLKNSELVEKKKKTKKLKIWKFGIVSRLLDLSVLLVQSINLYLNLSLSSFFDIRSTKTKTNAIVLYTLPYEYKSTKVHESVPPVALPG